MKNFEEFLNESEWSGDVETKFHPKEGIFTKSAEEIAKYLKDESKDLQQAMARLNFYINRAGKKLPKEDQARLENAKEKLHNMYESESIDENAGEIVTFEFEKGDPKMVELDKKFKAAGFDSKINGDNVEVKLKSDKDTDELLKIANKK